MDEIHADDRVSALADIIIMRNGAGFGNESRKRHKVSHGTVGTVESVSGANPHRVFDVRFGGRLVEGLNRDKIEKVSAA